MCEAHYAFISSSENYSLLIDLIIGTAFYEISGFILCIHPAATGAAIYKTVQFILQSLAPLQLVYGEWFVFFLAQFSSMGWNKKNRLLAHMFSRSALHYKTFAFYDTK